MTLNSYPWYWTNVAKANQERGDQRLGQLMFNVLSEMNPTLADQVRGDPTLDPFYEDQNIAAFVIWLDEKWGP